MPRDSPAAPSAPHALSAGFVARHTGRGNGGGVQQCYGALNWRISLALCNLSQKNAVMIRSAEIGADVMR